MRRASIVGYGSIGRRHRSVLETLGFDVTVVSRRAGAGDGAVTTLAQAFEKGAPDYVVIATETSRHANDLATLRDLRFKGPILVEKPLTAEPGDLATLPPTPLWVGYQLRFHTVLQRLKAEIGDHPVLMATFYVGQHLDTWRPGRSGRDSYSARRTEGGGVLRDLSHELDLADWLFGPCTSVAAMGGRFGNVTADSDDAWGILASHANCPLVTIGLNSLDHIGQRIVTVMLAERTIQADLVRGTLTINAETSRFETDRDAPIRALHSAVLAGGGEACDRASAERTVRVIGAVERAAASGGRVKS